MNHVYCISGLGADKRIFQKLHIENAQLHFIEWELPDKNDTMRSYALKLANQIKHTSIFLVGVSFGGMLASEISRHHKLVNIDAAPGQNAQLKSSFIIKKTIVISSCKSHLELPLLMRLAAFTGVHKVAPYQFILHHKTLNRFVFDLHSKDEELYLKRVMLQGSSVLLIKRSIHLILNWKADLPENIVHIHGSADRLLTPHRVKANYWVKDGGHFMIWNKADEISALINKLLQA